MSVTARAPLKAGFVPSPSELVDRARSMIPALQARAEQADRERRIPAETIKELHEAGFFRVLQPRRWGGYEMEPQVLYDIQIALAEGCISTGWTYGVLAGHAYEIALFADKAQREIWGADDTVLASSSYQPVGKVERVDGGFRLSGHWKFSSGCRHCDWVLLGAVIPPAKEGDPPDVRTFLLPRRDYEIVDAWYVFGLKASGSEDIVVKDAFVPDYRTHKSIDGFLCRNPGQIENDAPLYTLPWAQVFLRLVSTAAIGGARGAVKVAVEATRTRVSTNTGKVAKTDPIMLNAIARAWAQIDEMEAVLHRNFAVLMERARAGEGVSLERRQTFRAQSSSVARRCAALVDELLALLGGRAIYLDHPLVRYWLDLNAMRAHVANDPNNWGPDLAGCLLGQEPSIPFL
jgi:3-hydroxy-9,10-secoandrosta-1,3,5(10)-triene-9,17-dione monooxygenase